MKQKAELLYNQCLELIEQNMGSNTTNGEELNSACKYLFQEKFQGVYASDQIPKLSAGKYAITNLQKSTQPGSHWLALVKSKNGIYVYDSFGRKTIKILPALVESGNGVIKETENDKEQASLQTNCGQRCIAALIVCDNLGIEGMKYI
jgi:hypothetical protein